MKESEYPLSGSHNPLSRFLSGSLPSLFLSFIPLPESNWVGYALGGSNLFVSISVICPTLFVKKMPPTILLVLEIEVLLALAGNV